MKRFFLQPLPALSMGLFFGLFFVFGLPSTAGDTGLYEKLATNWLQHHVYGLTVNGVLTPLDIRMPGYPAFLALVQVVTHRGAEAARLWVMLAQVLLDLTGCVVIAALAARLTGRGENNSRVFLAALWLAALCPFTANYTAVPLTETFAVLLTSVALTSLVALLVRQFPARDFLEWAKLPRRSDFMQNAAFAGFCVGLGTLFPPQAPLLLLSSFPVLFWFGLRKSQL